MSSTMSREAAAMFREANRRRTQGAKIAARKTASSFGAGWIFGVRDVAETGQSRTVDGILVEPHTAKDILAAVDREPSILDMPFARVFDAAVGATFASRKTSAQSVTPDSLNSWVEFDHPFVVHADGTVSEASGVYAPSVYSYGGGDVEIDGSGWEFWSTGRSGQYSYRGPVMHPSEQLSGGLARDLLAEPGVYTITDVMDPEDMDALIGWVVLKSTTRTASRKGSGGKGGPSRRKTSSSINVIDLEVCGDCLMAAANGYDPHEWGRTADPEPWAEWNGYPGHPVAGDGEGHFSHQMCEGCGSRLAGDRYQAHWLEPKTASRKTASISLKNVGIESETVGVGTDPQGNKVRFRLTPQDHADLKSILFSDLAINFSGVEIEESDIIKDASKDASLWGPRTAASTEERVLLADGWTPEEIAFGDVPRHARLDNNR